jgi:hypothetical protein
MFFAPSSTLFTFKPTCGQHQNDFFRLI